jgi:hypothetical protein
MFQIWNCDGGVTIRGQNYYFPDIDSVAYTYNLKKHLIRGANAQNKKGIISQEGGKTSETAEYTVVDCSKALYKLLLECYEKNERIDAFFIDRATGEYIIYKDSIIRDKPRQTNIAEDDTSHSFVLAVESFNVTEKVANDE